ncbi:MAG: ABC transporter substrate-binding protein [Armatimonadota bacterium]|nr:ABC transporter substrate-binding protein [Armatimonadota bacterium]
MTWALHVPIDRLDPSASFSLATGMVVGRNVFDRLVEHDDQLNIRPGLALSWMPARDGRTWTFKLRQGVRFHDGTPFNADVVVFNVTRAVNPQLRLPAGSFAWAGVKGARRVDEYTVEIFGDQPLAALLNNIADSGLGVIISPQALQRARDPRDFVPVGTGPFKFVSWQPDGDLVLEANRDYWGGPPAIDRLVVRVSPTPSTRVAQLEGGEVDLITQVPLQEIQRLSAIRGIEVAVKPATSWTYIAMNNRKPAFADAQVRRALNHLVDKQTIIDKVLFGVGRPADSPIGSAYRVHKSVKVYQYDPGLARQLLDQAGWRVGADGVRQKDGQRLAGTLWVPVGRFAGGAAMAQVIASAFRGVGVDVRVQEVEFGFYLAEARRGPEESRIELVMAGWGTADPDTGLRPVLHSESWPPRGNNIAFYRNPRVDELLDRGAATMDPTGRTAIYHRVQELVMDDAPWLFLTERREAVAWRSHVRGIRFIPSSAGLIDVRGVSVVR